MLFQMPVLLYSLYVSKLKKYLDLLTIIPITGENILEIVLVFRSSDKPITKYKETALNMHVENNGNEPHALSSRIQL